MNRRQYLGTAIAAIGTSTLAGCNGGGGGGNGSGNGTGSGGGTTEGSGGGSTTASGGGNTTGGGNATTSGAMTTNGTNGTSGEMTTNGTSGEMTTNGTNGTSGAMTTNGTSGEMTTNGTSGGQSTANGSGSKATEVNAMLANYNIKLSKTTIPSGSVTFDITNSADMEHEYVVFATDLAEGKLPTKNNGNEVNEDASSLDLIDEAEDIEGGKSTTLTVDLDPGHYVALCNIPGHYKLGMHTGFTVK